MRNYGYQFLNKVWVHSELWVPFWKNIANSSTGTLRSNKMNVQLEIYRSNKVNVQLEIYRSNKVNVQLEIYRSNKVNVQLEIYRSNKMNVQLKFQPTLMGLVDPKGQGPQ